MFPDDSAAQDSNADAEESSDKLFMMISAEALNGQHTAKTLHLRGSIQGHPLLILVDSGSSHTFLSSTIAEQLMGRSSLTKPMRVQVANGDQLSCIQEIHQAHWYIQDYEFVSDMKVLALPCYGLILGMDWLASSSPMRVDWARKWLSIPYAGASVLLQGESSLVPADTVVQVILLEKCDREEVRGTQVPEGIMELLHEYSSLFEEPKGLPPSRGCDHSIPLIAGATPVNVRPYRYPPALKDEIERQVDEMLKQGVIQKSSSAFSSLVLLVKKKDNSWRFCVDYRYLNALTCKMKYPVPIFDELMDELAKARWFSKLDLKSGYHQIRLQPGEEYKTAFQTHCGHFEFKVMAFGLTGAPATFLGAMNETLAPVLRKCVLAFFDNILIYSATLDEHIVHLKQVLQLLTNDQWQVNLKKCEFAQTRISYLGHILSEKGISTDPAKIETIKCWPIPKNVKELRSFLGLAGYYRRFVHHFGSISKCLTDLLKKHTLFVWTDDHSAAFNTLKQALISAPVLAVPDFSKPFVVTTDASATGIGAVLSQQGHPLAFLSKALGPKNQGLSTYEKEYLAIIMAVAQWRSYLQLAEFTIFTDHKSLMQLNEQRLQTIWQQKVYSKLFGS